MFLLRPYQDELVGSMLHRAERQLGIGREQLLLRLTGHRLSSHSFLATQYNGIALACGMTPAEFLHKHSVMPYMTAYLCTSERRQAVSRLVDVHDNLRPTASVVRRSVLGEQWLRLCPACVEEELRRYGESFWHRVHQLCGVSVCVAHAVDLLVSELRIGRYSGIPPPHEVNSFQAPPNCALAHPVKLAIAAASAEALWSVRDHDCLVTAYQSQVREFGYHYLGGKMHGALLAHDLETYFGESFLARYDCSIGSSRKGRWPARLLQESAHHATTFKHVLLKVFLDSCPTPSSSRVDFEDRHRPKARNWAQIEDAAIDCLTDEVARHRAAGTRVNLEDLYDIAGIRSLVKHYKHQAPRLMMWIEQFKKFTESSRIPGRRPRR